MLFTRQKLLFLNVTFFFSCFIASAHLSIQAENTFPVNDLIDRLEHRERSLKFVDITVSSTSKVQQGWNDYLDARDEYYRDLAAFHQVSPSQLHPPQTDRLENQESQSTYFRLRRDFKGNKRIDQLEQLPVKMDQMDVLASWCFDGRVWQASFPNSSRGPLVTIEANPNIPAVEQILGFSHRRELAANSTIADPVAAESVLPYSAYLRWALSENYIRSDAELIEHSDLGDAMRVTLLVPEYGEAFLRQQLFFSPKYEFALQKIIVDSVTVDHSSNEVLPRRDLATRHEVTWTEFVEISENIWLPTKMEMESWATTPHPESEGGFQQLFRDGKPVTMPNGDRQIDTSKVVIRQHLIGTVSCSIIPNLTNQKEQTVECELLYPAGTIVNDKIADEVYQLTGVSPAIGATLRKTIERKDFDGRQVKDRPEDRWWYIWVLVINVIAGIIVIIVVLRNRMISKT